MEEKRWLPFHFVLLLIGLLGLNGCGGGFSASTASSTTLPISVKVNSTPYSPVVAGSGQATEVTIKAGETLELDSSASVSWVINTGNGNSVTGSGTLHLGGMTVTQLALTPTTWAVSISGNSLGNQATTQSFQVVAKSTTDGQTMETVTVNVTLTPPQDTGGWKPVALTTMVRSFAIDPSNTQTAYAQTTSGIYKTADGGNSWSRINSDLTAFVSGAFAVDPNNGQVVYAGADNSLGLIKSTDGGATWKAINNGLPAIAQADSVDGIVISPNDSQVVYAAFGFISAAMGQTGVYMTVDGGATWTKTGLALNVRTLAMDPTNPAILYAGTDSFSGLVQKSTDGGKTWNAAANGINFKDFTAVTALAIAKSSPQVMYLALVSGPIYKSVDGGVNWTSLAPTPHRWGITALAVDPGNDKVVYSADTSGAIYKSTDGGATWTDISKGQTSGSTVNTLTIDPANSQVVYAGTFGLYKTTTGGQ